MSRVMYRVQQDDTDAGLWYDRDGTFNNRIATAPAFQFLSARTLPMGYNETKAGGWLSAVDTLDGLFEWFTRDECRRLQELNIFIYAYDVVEFKWYEPYGHHLIRADSEVLAKVLIPQPA